MMMNNNTEMMQNNSEMMLNQGFTMGNFDGNGHPLEMMNYMQMMNNNPDMMQMMMNNNPDMMQMMMDNNTGGLNFTAPESNDVYIDYEELKRPKKRKRKSSVNLPGYEKCTDVKLFEDALLSLDSVSF